ncbi:uncharacterized protein HaLaN_32958, partial [Haematococcus lacustris]
VPALVAWCGLRDPDMRLAHPMTQDMINQVFDFYFRSYLRTWSSPVFSEALRTIPH